MDGLIRLEHAPVAGLPDHGSMGALVETCPSLEKKLSLEDERQ